MMILEALANSSAQVNGIANYLVVIFADLGLTGILPLLLYGE